jgi:hypothetical protein
VQDRSTAFMLADKRGNGAAMELLLRVRQPFFFFVPMSRCENMFACGEYAALRTHLLQATSVAQPSVSMPVSGQLRVASNPRFHIVSSTTIQSAPASMPSTPAQPSPAPRALDEPLSPEVLSHPIAALRGDAGTPDALITASASSPSPAPPPTPTAAPLLFESVYGLLERRQLLLYEAGTVDQRRGMLSLHRSMHFSPAATTIRVTSGGAWQLTCVDAGVVVLLVSVSC